jgi:hypothetical protein
MTVIYGGNMAFPIPNTGHGAPFDMGMSLRDYIAIHAMQASLMRQDDTVGRHAKYAYMVADAMLEHRVSGEQ